MGDSVRNRSSSSSCNSEDSFSSRSHAERRWKLFFDPEANKSDKKTFTLSDDDLRGGKMAELVDPDEEITEVFTYKIPLCEKQWTNLIFNYQYVVFKTPSYWWSIENNTDGVTLQRSAEKDAVTLRFCQHPRVKGEYWNVQLMKNGEGHKTMRQLILWLWKEDFLNIAYSAISNNSKYFAKRAFDELAAC